MSIDVVYPQVTEAIRRAERLGQDEPETAAAAHLDVSRLEEEIARLLPPDDEEGAIARRGAVRAALMGHDFARAQYLVQIYLREAGADARLKAELGELFDEHAPAVPEPSHAALEPVVVDSTIRLLRETAGIDEADFGATLSMLRREIHGLAEATAREQAVDRRFVTFLRRLETRVARSGLRQDELFGLAHARESLAGYRSVVEAEWPTGLAQRFASLDREYERTVGRLPTWRQFVHNASDGPGLTAEQLVNVPLAASMVAQVMRSDAARSSVEAAVPDALEALQSPLESESRAVAEVGRAASVVAGMTLLAEDVLQSINNILKAVVRLATGAAALVARHAPRGMAATRLGRGVLATTVGVASGGLAAWLTGQFPQMFGWLESVVRLLL